jgi:hypothetical protein
MRLRAPMPGDETEPRARGRGWLLAALPIVAYAVLALVEMPLDAQQPTGYIAHHMHGPWIYPMHEVVVCMAILLIETLLVTVMLAARSDTPLGGRAFMLSILIGIGTFLFAPFAIHADSTLDRTLGWSFVVVLWLFVFALGTGILVIVRAIARQARLWTMSRRRS